MKLVSNSCQQLLPSPVTTQIRTFTTSDTTLLSEYRQNENGIQMLSAHLHQQIFGKETSPPQPVLEDKLRRSREHLKKFIPMKTENLTRMTDIHLDLPPLQGNTIDDHFRHIATQEYDSYLRAANDFAQLKEISPLPSPETWLMASGWTRYGRDGSVSQVSFPNEPAIVLDVEICVHDGPYPTLATALSHDAWYGWVSPRLVHSSMSATTVDQQTNVITRESEDALEDNLNMSSAAASIHHHAVEDHLYTLIPLGDETSKLVIGHRVSFDRARIREEYRISESRHRFLDTASLHMVVNGMHNLSLQDVYHFYFQKNLDKSSRDYFIKGSLQEIRNNFAKLMNYCATDVRVTFEVYSKLWPSFLLKCPHPATFAGMLEMGSCYLPVDSSWSSYVTCAESTYQETVKIIRGHLEQCVANALEKTDPRQLDDDPWFRHLDWAVKPLRFTKPKLLKDGSVAPGGESRPIKGQKCPNMPQWYRELCPPRSQKAEVTIRTLVTPYLMRLAWNGFPLHYIRKFGWGYLVPRNENAMSDLASFARKNSAHTSRPSTFVTLSRCPGKVWEFFKLPHKDGERANCGNPLSKAYVPYLEAGILTSELLSAKEMLALHMQSSYWMGARQRIHSQFVHWRREDLGFQACEAQYEPAGAILPSVVVCGTVTRRAVEPTWMTASNANRDRIGSELKAKVAAPHGYCFVGADVDSEELWIAALFGDWYFGFHGATALGWMTLEGKKSDGTDMHSRSAEILGTSRENAKIFNYARIYGAGVDFATKLLLQFNSSLGPEEAKSRAINLYRQTKGSRAYLVKEDQSIKEENLAPMNDNQRHSLHRKIRQSLWKDGSESYTFTQLEAIATSTEPKTPVLNCEMAEFLLPKNIKPGEHLTTRVNWVVQSSGVDYLHLLLVAMRYLINKFDIDARLSITIHDELRYLVRQEDALRACLALQIANLWTRSMFAFKTGIKDLPLSVAFFSSIDIDHVLRKETHMSCITPSNPEGVPPGKSLNIYQILEATSGGLLTELQEAGRTITSFDTSQIQNIDAEGIANRQEIMDIDPSPEAKAFVDQWFEDMMPDKEEILGPKRKSMKRTISSSPTEDHEDS